jgi:hypothetical protein
MIAPSSLPVILLSAQLVLVVLEIQASVRFTVAETFLRADNYFSNLTFGVENLRNTRNMVRKLKYHEQKLLRKGKAYSHI